MVDGKREHAAAAVAGCAEAHVDDIHAVGGGPVERGQDDGVGRRVLRTEHPVGAQRGVRGDALDVRVVPGDDARDMGAVPGCRAEPVVVRVGVLVREVVAADHLRVGDAPAAERRMVVSDAAVDDADGDTLAREALAMGLRDAGEIRDGDDLPAGGAPSADRASRPARSTAFCRASSDTGVGFSGISYVTGSVTSATPGSAASRSVCPAGTLTRRPLTTLRYRRCTDTAMPDSCAASISCCCASETVRRAAARSWGAASCAAGALSSLTMRVTDGPDGSPESACARSPGRTSETRSSADAADIECLYTTVDQMRTATEGQR